MKALKYYFEITEEMKLPEPFKTDWLKDLRSGEYGQTSGQLTDFNGNYCCLGIACKTAGYKDYILKGINGISAGVINKGDDGSCLKYDLKKVPKQIKGGSFDNDVVEFLTLSNDAGATFKQIANWIEKYL